MINTIQTLKNLNNKFPDKTTKELIEILECIEDNESYLLKLDTNHSVNEDFMYFTNPPVYD